MKSAIRAIAKGTAARVGREEFHGLAIDKTGFRKTPLGRVLAVLVATIVVLILSAIVLPPKGSQAGPGEVGGKAPVAVSH